MNLKNKIFVVAAAIALMSCEASFLDRTPYSSSSPENFYTDDAGRFTMALAGCYEMLNGRCMGENETSVVFGTFYQGLQWILGCPSDEIVSASTAVPYTMAQATFLESDKGLIQMWDAYFNGIYRCNELLANLGILTDPLKPQFEAEARFMRAFYYYHLALVFGALPIVEYGSDGQEPRSPLSKVYDEIITDLEFAYANLAERGILNPLSANKYTAAAYLARVCNYLAACKRNNVGADLLKEQPLNDFSWVDAAAMSLKARNAAVDVIEHSGYVLVDNYDMLFRETTKAEQYKECLFMADQPLSGSEGKWPESCRMAAPAGSAAAPQVYGNVLMPNPLLFYLYDKTDLRRDHNFTCFLNGSYDAGTILKETIDGYVYPKPWHKRSTNATYKLIYNADTQTFNPCVANGYGTGKYRMVEKGALQHPVSSHALSYPLMRLADVYLMAAEAEYFVSGDADAARAYLRPVVLRAAGKDETACDNLMAAYKRADFVDEILESRERELVFEFSRKTDLIRFGRIDDAIAAMSTTTAVSPEFQALYPGKKFTPNSNVVKGINALQANWRHNKIWAPISTAQMAVNPNLSQNAQW